MSPSIQRRSAHHDDKFADVTELPFQPPPSVPMSHANMQPVGNSVGQAPDQARNALATLYDETERWKKVVGNG